MAFYQLLQTHYYDGKLTELIAEATADIEAYKKGEKGILNSEEGYPETLIDTESSSEEVPLVVEKELTEDEKFRRLKFNTFAEFEVKFKDHPKFTQGFPYFKGIVTDFLNNSSSNVDGINKLVSDDIMFIVLEKLRGCDEECLFTLFEQFADMGTGFCPQGRTIRLLQIYNYCGSCKS